MKYFPKLSAVCDTASHLFLSAVISRGPSWDHEEFRQTVLEAHQQQPFEHLVADAGYDMERCHGVVREKLGAKTTIRLRKRPRPGVGRRGECRQEMEDEFDSEAYGQRWQIESAFSRCKKRLGSALKARNVWAQRREIQLRVLTHNLMIT
jgi:transposase